MELILNSREKEILIDVLEAHLETLDDRINDGDDEFKEERDTTDRLLYKFRYEA